VLLKLAGLSAKDGHSYASVGYLAAACGATSRAISKVLKMLRKDGMVRVQHRKGHSSRIFVNWEAVQALPLALPPSEGEQANEEEQPKAAEQPEPAKPSPAQDLASRIRFSICEKFPQAEIPSDWQTGWPAEIQKLLDAGRGVEAIRSVARFALSFQYHGEELAKAAA